MCAWSPRGHHSVVVCIRPVACVWAIHKVRCKPQGYGGMAASPAGLVCAHAGATATQAAGMVPCCQPLTPLCGLCGAMYACAALNLCKQTAVLPLHFTAQHRLGLLQSRTVPNHPLACTVWAQESCCERLALLQGAE